MTWSVLEEIASHVDTNVRDNMLSFHAGTNWLPGQRGCLPHPSRIAMTLLPSEVALATAHHDHPLTPLPSEWLMLDPPRCDGPFRHPSAVRFCTDTKVDSQTVSDLLASAFRAFPDGRRPYPSAGALYPAGVIFLGFRSRLADEKLAGAFHYRPSTHTLEPLNAPDEGSLRQAVFCEFSGEMRKASFVLVYFFFVNVAIFKYRYRGYRNALLEIGAMGQQVDLVAPRLGLATRLWSGFGDLELAQTIGLNPAVAPIIITQVLGPKQRNK